MVKLLEGSNTQNDSPLFKLAAETRNRIYEFLYTPETNEDGSIQLNNTIGPAPPSKTLTMTCKQTHNEARAMYRAAYQSYPSEEFTLSVPDRRRLPFVPAISNDVFCRIKTIRVTWRADEYNEHKPLRLTTRFTRIGKTQRWDVRIEMLDEYFRGARAAREIIHH